MIGHVSGEGEGDDVKKTIAIFTYKKLSFEPRHENKSC